MDAQVTEAGLGGRVDSCIVIEGLVEPGYLKTHVDGVGEPVVALEKDRRRLSTCR